MSFQFSDEMWLVSDGADWTSTGRLFQSRGPAAANANSNKSRRTDIKESGLMSNYFDHLLFCWWALKWCRNGLGTDTGKCHVVHEQSTSVRRFLSGKKRADVNTPNGTSECSPVSLRSSRRHLSYDDCTGDKRENYQNCSVLYCVRQLCTMIRSRIWAVLKAECWFRFSFCAVV